VAIFVTVRYYFAARTPPLEARSPGRSSNVENAPCRQPVTGQPATPTCGIRREMLRTPHHPLVTNQQRAHTTRKLGFMLCCHSNATHAPIANPPNSAQLGGSLYHAPKLHRVRAVVWAYSRGQTDTQTRVTTIYFASSTTHAKCNYSSTFYHELCLDYFQYTCNINVHYKLLGLMAAKCN